MQIQEYLLHYQAFHKEHFPLAGLPEKEFKLACECREFIDAYTTNLTDDCKIDEAIDVMNTAIAFLYAHGVVNPLFAGYQKLQRTSKKYREAHERRTSNVGR